MREGLGLRVLENRVLREGNIWAEEGRDNRRLEEMA
jgi:hypothetical protein